MIRLDMFYVIGGTVLWVWFFWNLGKLIYEDYQLTKEQEG